LGRSARATDGRIQIDPLMDPALKKGDTRPLWFQRIEQIEVFSDPDVRTYEGATPVDEVVAADHVTTSSMTTARPKPTDDGFHDANRTNANAA
jgi:hypothetical protein